MNSCSRTVADSAPAAPTVARARPLLGTVVSIRIAGLDEAEANRAIDRGFAAVAEVHRLMSFHEPGSDVSRLNREASGHPVAADPHTIAVLRHAEAVSRASRGAFDITVAGDLVAAGALPHPDGAPEPDSTASWRDIELLEDDCLLPSSRARPGTAGLVAETSNQAASVPGSSLGRRVRFARPLWLDLGGIAKGYAVDRALAAMDLPQHVRSMINAGGDLRVSGPLPEPVRLAMTMPGAVPVVAIEQGSLASSTGATRWGAVGKVHRHGATRRRVGARRFASVAAESCMTADALTKVVLALGPRAESVLRAFGATGYLYSARSGWRILGG